MSERIKKDYVDVVRELKESEFKDMPTKGTTRDTFNQNAHQVIYNMHSMFDMPFTQEELEEMPEDDKLDTEGARIMDYAIVRAVWEAFKNHPYHKKFFKTLDRENEMGWFMLQYGPDIIDEEGYLILE